jgi:transposase
MAPPDTTVFDAMAGDRKKNCQFDPDARKVMVTLASAGLSIRRIAKLFRTTHSTVSRIVKDFETDRRFEPRPRSGRPRKQQRAKAR